MNFGIVKRNWSALAFSVRVFLIACVTAFSPVIIGATSCFVAGCAGSKARDIAMKSAFVLASEGVSQDAKNGIAFSVTDDAKQQAEETVALFFDSLKNQSRSDFKEDYYPVWPSIKSWAEHGIRGRVVTGEIGDGVGKSLQERVNNFDAALASYVAK